GYVGFGIPKSEARNPKQIAMTETANAQNGTGPIKAFGALDHSCFVLEDMKARLRPPAYADGMDLQRGKEPRHGRVYRL
ncbi:MAG TPA: hypothetical protein VNA25_25105, partial [Phycisphaerae bacterium]|nr:hypothetical protein [Phycisphaerae bacterium]